MGSKILRSSSHHPVPDTSWADGLRGIASIYVVASHITLCFARSLIPPSKGQDGPATLFQRPFFRLIAQGNAFVSIFFVLLGFCNSLRALQLSRAGCIHDALSTLSTSSLRRPSRLVIPAAVVTVGSWLLCQLNFYYLAQRSDAFWLQTTTPVPSASWRQAVADLVKELISTWVHGENWYDQPQWALLHLFRGSMVIFTVLLATVNTTIPFRITAELLLYLWSWVSNDSIVLINVFAGMILAELSFHTLPHLTYKSANILPYPFAILGLYLCSYPDQYAEQARWSRQLMHLGMRIFPPGASFGRFWSGLGAQLLCLAIVCSPAMRGALSRPYLLWLGRLSYPIYLLHGTLIRTCLTWLTFGPSVLMWTSNGESYQDGMLDAPPLIPEPTKGILVVALPVFFAVLLAIANAWAVKVEPVFERLAAAFERFARTWGKGSKVYHDELPSKLNGKAILPTFANE
ncbi:hypothetical protein PAAG_02083 [Paracoccidioides lutzii Pb01]|uniref:Acyltransferase 3 domain-containing protein n=1 Tax=Paracoccidioides lutzii (strain ATCC MYA-826 / Pb01) TaxID=502779 RepID=C1GU88_PARBA|nr:hypothetical protein PAAG_02083 [Paracoccidioides lutzii Pb01]EEH39894.1 hypothetical protein PAAG_02083 [Paracoccidioides lutzii Pb01]